MSHSPKVVNRKHRAPPANTSTSTSTASAASRSTSGSLPSHIEEIRSKVFVRSTHLEHANEAEDPDAFHSLQYDNSFTLDKFKAGLKIQIHEKSDEHLIFDLVGVGAPIANALRRILLSDVPTMAIEKVILFQNTSIIQDEVLAHRLGLIPIKADPKMFRTLEEDGGEPNEHNTTVFTLEVMCTNNPRAQPSAPPNLAYINSTVYSSQLQWVPQGTQAERFASDPIRPVHDDIVVAKLRPGQSIEAELHVIKGVGRDHAKWSPVATAYYRQMPDISFTGPVTGDEAKELAAICPMNVFDIEDIGNGNGPELVTARPRNCTMCRECVREPRHEKKVKLRRVRDHFICTLLIMIIARSNTSTHVFRLCYTSFLKGLRFWFDPESICCVLICISTIITTIALPFQSSCPLLQSRSSPLAPSSPRCCLRTRLLSSAIRLPLC